MKIFFLFTLCFFLVSTSPGQRSIGEVKKNDKLASDTLIDVPPKYWFGKRFIFLETSKMLQEFGYNLHLTKNWYSSRSINPELEREPTYNLRYDKFVGKTMKVVEIEDKSFDPVISFMIDNSNLMVYGKPYKGHIKGIALFDDLDKAKARWLGKTLYSKTRSILTYDAQADKYGEVKVQIGSALKVNDIWFGLHATEPLWLIVETPEGAKGAIPTAFSWTNFYSDWWKDTRPWEDKFYEFNPKEKFKWSLEIWQLINDGKVRIGMTKEQVRLAWGRPKKANEDIYQGSVREQWVYDSQYLYFENEKLTAMQNR